MRVTKEKYDVVVVGSTGDNLRLTEPIVSRQQFGKILGQMVMQLSGGSVIMQRVGDFRLGSRSKKRDISQ